MNAPKLWPPAPTQWAVNTSSGRVLPYLRVISLPKMAPKARSVLDTFRVTLWGFLLPSLNFFMSTFMSRVFSRWKS